MSSQLFARDPPEYRLEAIAEEDQHQQQQRRPSVDAEQSAGSSTAVAAATGAGATHAVVTVVLPSSTAGASGGPTGPAGSSSSAAAATSGATTTVSSSSSSTMGGRRQRVRFPIATSRGVSSRDAATSSIPSAWPPSYSLDSSNPAPYLPPALRTQPMSKMLRIPSSGSGSGSGSSSTVPSTSGGASSYFTSRPSSNPTAAWVTPLSAGRALRFDSATSTAFYELSVKFWLTPIWRFQFPSASFDDPNGEKLFDFCFEAMSGAASLNWEMRVGHAQGPGLWRYHAKKERLTGPKGLVLKCSVGRVKGTAVPSAAAQRTSAGAAALAAGKQSRGRKMSVGGNNSSANSSSNSNGRSGSFSSMIMPPSILSPSASSTASSPFSNIHASFAVPSSSSSSSPSSSSAAAAAGDAPLRRTPSNGSTATQVQLSQQRLQLSKIYPIKHRRPGGFLRRLSSNDTGAHVDGNAHYQQQQQQQQAVGSGAGGAPQPSVQPQSASNDGSPRRPRLPKLTTASLPRPTLPERLTSLVGITSSLAGSIAGLHLTPSSSTSSSASTSHNGASSTTTVSAAAGQGTVNAGSSTQGQQQHQQQAQVALPDEETSMWGDEDGQQQQQQHATSTPANATATIAPGPSSPLGSPASIADENDTRSITSDRTTWSASMIGLGSHTGGAGGARGRRAVSPTTSAVTAYDYCEFRWPGRVDVKWVWVTNRPMVSAG